MVPPQAKNDPPVYDGPSSRKAVIVFEGDLGALPLAEVVQMGCVGRQRFWVEVWSDGQLQGAIVLDAGDVVGAATSSLRGDDAFFFLARVLHGRFRVYPAGDGDRGVLPATTRPWHELLLETARLSDEDGRPSSLPASGTVVIPPSPAEEILPPTLAPPPVEPVIPPAAPPSGPIVEPASKVPAEPPASGYETLLRAATEAYLRRDYGEALQLFEACLALRPGDRSILHNIERLRNRNR